MSWINSQWFAALWPIPKKQKRKMSKAEEKMWDDRALQIRKMVEESEQVIQSMVELMTQEQIDDLRKKGIFKKLLGVVIATLTLLSGSAPIR